MRIPSIILCVFMGCQTLLRGPVPLVAQSPPPGGEPKINISELGFGQEEMREWARKQGIPEGKLTLEQLLAYTQSPEAARARARKLAGGRTQRRPAATPSSPAAPGPTATAGRDTTPAENTGGEAARDPQLTALADKQFRQLDQNGDGFLGNEEMTENLKLERDRWDANQDGQIDRIEWRNYVWAFNEKRRREAEPPPRAQPLAQPRPAAGRKPSPRGVPGQAGTVPHGGGLLTGAGGRPLMAGLGGGLPPWFNEYDTDSDGQVSLGEWTAKAGTLPDFREVDKNGDGFITELELTRAGKQLLAKLIQTARKQQQLRAPRSHPDALPDPGSLTQYRNQIGSTHLFEITGRSDGGIWGTDLYTDDSPIAVAAVHAGVVAVGQKAVVRVTILQGQEQYAGTSRNGVTSGGYAAFGGSYTITAAH